MSVDLSDRIRDLKAAANPPGENLYPTAEDADWLDRLINAFWDAVLEGVLAGYAVDDDGVVDPTTPGAPDMGRDMQQVIVLYAAWKVVAQKLLSLKAEFRAQAGPVRFETATSATVLRELLLQVRAQLDAVIARLGDRGAVDTVVLDSVLERTQSVALGDTWWVR